MIKLLISNLPLIYLTFIIVCYLSFILLGKQNECLGNRSPDSSGLMEIHSIAIISGFIIPIFSIFRIVKKKIVIIIPYFIDLSTSYLIHRIGLYIIKMINIYLNDTKCSKDEETLNGINHYSYAIVYFFLLFIKLLNSSDTYPSSQNEIISLCLTFPQYNRNQSQLFYQGLGPFSCHYSSHCQNYLRYNKKCIFHSIGYVILGCYIVAGSLCLGHILIHGYATVNQIFYGVVFSYLMTYIFDIILYLFKPMVKAIIFVSLLYSFTCIVYSYIVNEKVKLSFYHLICFVDLLTAILVTYSVHTQAQKQK